MSSKLIVKVIGTAEHINNLIDFLPIDTIRSISEKKPNGEDAQLKHQFLHLDMKQLAALVEVQKEVSKRFMEGVR